MISNTIKMIFLSFIFIMSRKDNKLKKNQSLPICESFIQNKLFLPGRKYPPEYHTQWCPPNSPLQLLVTHFQKESLHRPPWLPLFQRYQSWSYPSRCCRWSVPACPYKVL